MVVVVVVVVGGGGGGGGGWVVVVVSRVRLRVGGYTMAHVSPLAQYKTVINKWYVVFEEGKLKKQGPDHIS